jgi:hypothetical protein
MKLRNSRYILLSAVLLAASLVFASSGRHDEDDDWNAAAKAQETIQKTFAVASPGEKSLIVDNVFGSIEVVGSPSDQVQVVANKTIRGRSQADVERAKKEVTLEMTQDGNRVRLYVNGPFRCHNSGPNCCNWEDRHYEVTYDFKLQVPQRINLELKTVNGGSLRVQRVRGNYDVDNVNGPIDMDEVGGSGHVHTVNGGVRVTFVENPTQNSDFGTINGDIDLYFAPKLSADFRFKTMQGEVYSDFPMTELPRDTGKSERRNGKFVFSADRFTGGRVGTGGPEIKMENLNGDLRVLARTN